jgi:hypothetical protein
LRLGGFLFVDRYMPMPDAVTAAIDTSQFVPAQEVVDELRLSALPRQARAAMTALSIETLLGNPMHWPYSWSPFRCTFGFTEWPGSLDTFPAWGGNAEHDTHAFSVWQNEPDTYAEIVALTGDPKMVPQSAIANNWVLAVRDFRWRTGGDLLATLKAGGAELDRVSPALIKTWPAGADANFPARYIAALQLYPADPPPPPAPPPVPPPAPGGATITLRPGLQASFPIAGTDQDDQPFTPSDALITDASNICTVAIASTPAGATATVAAPLSAVVGTTRVHGADFAITVDVEAPRLVHLTADLTKIVYTRIPMAAAAALAAMMLLAAPADVPQGTSRYTMSSFAASNEVAKSDMPAIQATSLSDSSDRQVKLIGQLGRELPRIGDDDFCYGRGQTMVAMLRCLRWTAALSRR